MKKLTFTALALMMCGAAWGAAIPQASRYDSRVLMRRAINKGEKRDKCLCCCVTNREKELQKQSAVNPEV